MSATPMAWPITEKMAGSVTSECLFHQIPTPAPVYLRSSSFSKPFWPNIPSLPPAHKRVGSAMSSGKPPECDSELNHDPRFQTPVSSVRTNFKSNSPTTPPASNGANAIENHHNEHETPMPPIPASAKLPMNRVRSEDSDTAMPSRRSTISPQARSPPNGHSRTPNSIGSWSVVEPGDGDKAQNNSADQRRSPAEHDFSNGNRTGSRASSLHSSSRGSAVTFENFEPLNYFHKPLRSPRESSRPRNNGTEPNGSRPAKPFAPHRPASRASSASDYSNRQSRQSPRPRARNSASPADNRPVSFVDLLNTPYPQTGPMPPHSAATGLLRSSVGKDASLLSHAQTFNMYLENVKKTGNMEVQYEFAVFLINSTHQMPPEELDDGTNSGRPGKNSEVTRTRLVKEAKAIFQRLSDRSYPFAQYYLADGYASGLFNKGSPAHNRAFSLFVAASKHGHVEACYRAALCYEFGWGCWVDGAKAEKFYRHAASKKHPGAMLRMYKACMNGDMGLGKRYREGVSWLNRASESADTHYNSGPYELGLLHETGHGDDVFPDASYAAQMFTKSAGLGHTEASFRMGDAYEHGKLNCPCDPALSIHFYTGAAQGGHLLSMMALCAWYLVGAEPVLDRDECEAYEWAKKAAELGLPKAQYAVGYFTEMGIGCRRDILEANVWYVTAADHGDERAKHRIAAIQAAAEGTNPKFAGAVVQEKKPNGENNNNNNNNAILKNKIVVRTLERFKLI